MPLKLLVLSLLVVALDSFANKVTVYRWVDENNVVHFSQHQPSHTDFVELTMSVNKPNPPSEKSVNDEDNVAEQSIASNTSAANSDNLCQTAKANIRTLKAYDKIQYTDGTGQVHVLSAMEKSQQLAMNEKQVEVYCQ